MDLAGKVALVTGGGVRIGQGIVLALADAGCHVMIHYGQSARAAEETAVAARELGVRAAVHGADLSDAAAVDGIIPAACEALGRVDILINNAAIFPEEDRFDATDAALWERLFAINLRAPFFLSQAFASRLEGSHQGAIVNIADARTRQPGTDHFAYRLTKGGLWQMTEMLAAELAPAVRVNAVALGAILPPPGQGEDYIRAYAQRRVPLGHPGGVATVTENVLHLLRQPFLTGAVVPLDGGEFL